MGVGLLRSVLVACILAAAVSPAQAQYFGRNKVRYDEAGFHTLQTAHFDIYFRPDSAEAAQVASGFRLRVTLPAFAKAPADRRSLSSS